MYNIRYLLLGDFGVVVLLHHHPLLVLVYLPFPLAVGAQPGLLLYQGHQDTQDVRLQQQVVNHTHVQEFYLIISSNTWSVQNRMIDRHII
jgi:hypothetical protein